MELYRLAVEVVAHAERAETALKIAIVGTPPAANTAPPIRIPTTKPLNRLENPDHLAGSRTVTTPAQNTTIPA